MKECISTRCLFALSWVLILLSVLSSTALAAETPEWTIDIAHQLLAEGWEAETEAAEAAVVGYAIHFVELERSQARSLSLGFNLETGEESAGLWEVTSGDEGLVLRGDTPSARFTADLMSNFGHQSEMASLESWLLTTEGKALHVDISSTHLPKPTGEYREDSLAITILPTSLHADGKIQSEVSLSYETMSGTMARLQTNTLVGTEAQEPIAVVARKVNASRKLEYQYFAVYLAGMQIPRDLIPEDAALLPMGSIVGLQQFMEEGPEPRSVEIAVDLAYGDSNFGMLLDVSIPVGQKHRIYGEFSSFSRAFYFVGVEGALEQGLHLLAEVGTLTDGEAAFQLGVCDELQFGEGLYLSASVLPIRFTFNSVRPKLVVNWRVKVEFSRESFGLFYKLDNDLKRMRHNVGVSVLKNNSVGARLSMSWDELNRGVVAVGIELRF